VDFSTAIIFLNTYFFLGFGVLLSRPLPDLLPVVDGPLGSFVVFFLVIVLSFG
jgi:hypothetical protein